MVRTILSLVLVASLWSSAEAAVLCARKGPGGNPHGNVTIRETCKSKEMQLDPSALGLQGPAVYDATGKKIGDITDLDSDRILLLSRFDPYTVQLGVRRDGTFESAIGGNLLRFESTDCTGTPLIPFYSRGGFISPATVSGPGQTLYIGNPQAPPQLINYHSSLERGSPSCLTTNDLETLVPAIVFGDLSPLFTPPFSVR